MTRRQLLDELESGELKYSKLETNSVTVSVYGDTAVVTGKSTAKGSINGIELKGPVMFTRVYVKKNGKWQSVAFQQTPIVAP